MHALRYAWRSLRTSPGLAVAGAFCIGLGAAATMAVATLAQAVLLRPVPFPQPERLVRVWLDEAGVDPRISFSIPESREIRRLGAFDAALATARVRATAVAGDRAERLRGEAVDAGYFDVLGLRPALGRLLEPGDHRPDAPPAVVIADGFWRRAFGGRASAVGSTLATARATYVIVGVAPRGFSGTVEDDQVEFWTAIEKYEPQRMLTDPDTRQTWMLARLAPGATLAEASAQVSALGRDWAGRDPVRYRERGLRLEPFGESWRRGLRGGTLLLVGAAGALLAIAALNVGCLLLARVLDRRRELAIRAAVGAGRSDLVAQLLVEALLVSAAGAAIGLSAGPALLRTVLAMSPVALPGYLTVAPDWQAGLVALAALVTAALVAGTVPALVGGAAGASSTEAFRSRGTAARGERRWVAILIGAETALTLTLLVCGTLMLRSYEGLASLDLGYRRTGIARLAVTLSAADAGPQASRAAVYERLRAAIAAVPGVTSVGLVTPTLPPWDADRARVRVDGLDARPVEQGLPVGVHISDHGLLPTLGIPLVAGRNFHRTEAAPVAIVSQGLAERMGGVDRAIGRAIEFPTDPALMSRSAGRFTIVGVAGNVAWDGLAEQDTRRLIHYANAADPRAGRWDVYLPLAQSAQTIVSIAAATDESASAIVEPVRRAIAAVAPASPVHWTSTMEDEVALEYAPARFYSVITGVFSVSAMLLTGAGLLALLWFDAARRTGEMGLRLALGASRRSVAGLIVRSGLAPVIGGGAAGLLGALWAADAIGALLYDVSAFDPLSFAAAAGLLGAVAALATTMPARRAARVDPLVALRQE